MIRVRIKERKEKKFRNKKLMILFIIISLAFLVAAYNNQYYNIPKNSYKYAEEYGTCYKVQVGASPGAGVFLPSKTSSEWSNFINNHPASVTLGSSDYDGDGYDSDQCVTGTDCYDNNANAHPGQTSYFSTDRGDGSYDYNCDGSQTKHDPILCDSLNFGWSSIEGVIPSCGATGNYCKPGCVGCYSYTQPCN